jgi:hypothetical protein
MIKGDVTAKIRDACSNNDKSCGAILTLLDVENAVAFVVGATRRRSDHSWNHRQAVAGETAWSRHVQRESGEEKQRLISPRQIPSHFKPVVCPRWRRGVPTTTLRLQLALDQW